MRKYIVLILLATLVVSFILGLYLHKLNTINEQIAFEAEYEKIESENIIKEAKKILQETSNIENKVSPNTKLIEKRYYNNCGHIVQTEQKITEELANKSEAEFQIEYIGWEIQKFTQNEIIVYREINDFCNEHFLVKEVEGEIIVYGLDKYGNERETIRETGLQTKYLSEVDIENLKKGIKVYSITELNKLLEDFE